MPNQSAQCALRRCWGGASVSVETGSRGVRVLSVRLLPFGSRLGEVGCRRAMLRPVDLTDKGGST